MVAVVPIERDLKLDFFRGLALWLLFLDQLPAPAMSPLAIGNYGFSDATEIIVFVFGYTAGFVYAPLMQQRGFRVATANIFRRAWQVYVAHVFLFVFYIAEVSYVSRHFDNPLFTEDMNVFEFLHHPDTAVFQGLMLNFKAVHIDVLPVYILMLCIFPGVLWLLLRRPLLALAAAALCYGLARTFGWNLPAYPSGGWPLNPFAWQFLFILAAWCGVAPPKTWDWLIHSRTVLVIAAGYVAASLAIVMALHFPSTSDYVPGWLVRAIYPMDKTDLDPLPLTHFLALAILGARLVHPQMAALQWPLLRPITMCGRYLVEIYCITVFVIFAAESVLAEFPSSLLDYLLAAAAGLIVMSGVALFIAWLEPLTVGPQVRAMAKTPSQSASPSRAV